MALLKTTQQDPTVEGRTRLNKAEREFIDGVHQDLGLGPRQFVIRDGQPTSLVCEVGGSQKHPQLDCALTYGGREGFRFAYARDAYLAWLLVSGAQAQFQPMEDVLHNLCVTAFGHAEGKALYAQLSPRWRAAEGYAMAHLGEPRELAFTVSEAVEEGLRNLSAKLQARDVAAEHEQLTSAIRKAATAAQQNALDALPDAPTQAAYHKGKADLAHELS